MKNLVAFILIVSMMSMFSCGKDGVGTLDLVFQANYGDDVLEFNSVYTMLDDKEIKISRSDFFLSDIRLVADDGREELLYDIMQIDFEDTPQGLKFEIPKVKTGTYTSIRFGLGVNSELNKTEPSDHRAENPLNNSGYYWSGWNSYIFSKTEGKLDEDGSGEFSTGWIFHTGIDELYQEVTIPINKVLAKGDGNEIRLILDHKPLFEIDGEAVELGLNHDPDDLDILGTFLDRMAASFEYVD